MVGTALTLSSLAASAFGLSQSAKLNRQRQEAINKRRTMNDAWFNKEYYGDYYGRPEVKSTLQLIKDRIKDQQTKTASTAAITGATDESQLAAQQAQEEGYNETVKGLAGNIQAQKEAARREKVEQDMVLDQEQAQLDTEKGQSNANLLNNAVSLGTTVLGTDFSPINDKIKGLFAKKSPLGNTLLSKEVFKNPNI